ncbi:phage major capsid protein [Gluconobacter cerinus]|uniref:phage major capsid protein n=1 Tax=Gluconobacter cerinus TaxID=38307 RepID=UPI001B8CB7EE|nr:phage major capsid protein [Gluconobacter cerinus]MBS0984604.1 phage major capsid protein [Gluconobacter cerinus]
MAVSIKEFKKKLSDINARRKELTDDIDEAILNGEDCADKEAEADDLESKASKLSKRIKEIEDAEDKEEEYDEAEIEASEKSLKINPVHYVGQKADMGDALKCAARHLAFRAWAETSGVGVKGANERFIKAYGREAFDTQIKASPMTVGSLNFQAPNYRPEMLIPLLNKGIVTNGVLRQVQLENNNLIAPRMISGSTGSFNLENGLISTTSIGTDVKVLEGKFYGSIINTTAQALNFSGGILEDLIAEEMQTRHKLIVEQILLNGTDGTTTPLGFKGYTSQTQNILTSDFSALTGTDTATSFSIVQLFSDMVMTAQANMRQAGEYADLVLILPETVLGKLRSRAMMTGDYSLGNILDNGFFGIEIRGSNNLSTDESSLVTGATASTDIAPGYLIAKDKVWQGNGNFYEFKPFDSGIVGDQNLIQQVGHAYRLVDSIATALTNDVSLTRLEFKGLVTPADNSNTFYAQTASGQVSTATGNGTAKTTGTGNG